MQDATILSCPHCGQLNRVKTADLTRQPDCGQCHRALFTGHPIALTEANFSRHVGKSELPVLVDFWAPWCGPCLQMAPAFEQAASLLEPQVRLAKLNTEQAQGLAAQFAIRSIPTLALFHKGREVARQAGAMSLHDIVRWARQHLPVDGV
jgi:thioredoxin 2